MNEISNFILYTTPNGHVQLDILLQDENLWLTQKGLAELFGVERSVITKHLKNIYDSGELDKVSTCAKFAQVQQEGNRAVRRELEYYNLDAIISVGYRVNSSKATQFRIWATKTLKEFIIKGFVLDDERLEQGQTVFGQDYFRELLERIRSIRSSERRIYQQITDIFAECAIDYDQNSDITKNFYAMVQNKFHYAITGSTAAEIIYQQADASREKMELTSWKNAPDGRVLKSDVTVAKNYLQEKEIRQLERTVTAYFDYIESLVERRNTFTMRGLADSIDRFLSFNEYEILEGKGSISKKQADSKAIQEYEKFNRTQKILSDFDKHILKIMRES
ncbi:virulence protein [Streptococcus pneumoniae]|uniref:virulence RhuM family protein n=1 Tax=Streptococcus pneumoniae TaxID=1313 RepID=UPI000768AD1E|nr:virulence RhuM family protein [Streptococcus pneumoniae]VJB15095.1 virulence protein [Streptococcus pneumoniae]